MYDSFPYQQFGVKFGALSWISPTASTSTFRAIAEIDAESVMVLGQPTPLKAGMGGRAEVVIARRSLISFALDPIRQIRENMAAPPFRTPDCADIWSRRRLAISALRSALISNFLRQCEWNCSRFPFVEVGGNNHGYLSDKPALRDESDD